MSIDFSLDNVGPLDHSSNGPMIKWSEEWWAERPALKRCIAHRKNGKQCKHPPMHGTTVCRNHGGAAPQVKQAAKVRLEMATDKMAGFLLDLAADSTIPEGVRLSAVKDALDRGGLGAKQSMEIEVSAKPFENVFSKVISGPREIEPVRDQADDSEDEPGSLKARLLMRNQTDEYSDVVPRVEDM